MFKDTISFNKLQELARRSMEMSADNRNEEEMHWFEKLQKADPKSNYQRGR
jgi:hypothetical protein